MEDDWREGQEVEAIRIVKKWRLSKREAEEMNEGENPLYPWQIDRFVAVDLSVRQQERDSIGKWLRGLSHEAVADSISSLLTHLAAMVEDGDHANKAGE